MQLVGWFLVAKQKLNFVKFRLLLGPKVEGCPAVITGHANSSGRFNQGGLPEWLNGTLSKSVEPEKVP